MSSSQQFDKGEDSDSEVDFGIQVKTRRQLRTRNQQNSYQENLNEIEDGSPLAGKDSDAGISNQLQPLRSTRNRGEGSSSNLKAIIKDEMHQAKRESIQKSGGEQFQGEEDDDFEDGNNAFGGGAEEVNYQEAGGIFFPEIDQILWRREQKAIQKSSENENSKKSDQPEQVPLPQYQYYVKYKDYSYLHCEWLDEKQVVADSTAGKNRLNRFNKAFQKKIQDLVNNDHADIEDLNESQIFFDPSYIEVDRIIKSTELFPIIHPKQANEIKSKWSESLVNIVSKLLNYSKDNVHYGIYFMEPVNPQLDNCPDYRQKITNPMDLGTISNRLYLDYYKTPQHFWTELGFVFKNCRIYNKDPESDVRILGDTLRQCAIELYRQWYEMMKEKYELLMDDYQCRNDVQYREKKEQEEKTYVEKLREEEYHKYFDNINKICKDFAMTLTNSTTASTDDKQGEPKKAEKTLDHKEEVRKYLSENHPSYLTGTQKFDEIISDVNPENQELFVDRLRKEEVMAPDSEFNSDEQENYSYDSFPQQETSGRLRVQPLNLSTKLEQTVQSVFMKEQSKDAQMEEEIAEVQIETKIEGDESPQSAPYDPISLHPPQSKPGKNLKKLDSISSPLDISAAGGISGSIEIESSGRQHSENIIMHHQSNPLVQSLINIANKTRKTQQLIEVSLSIQEIEKLNPGKFTFDWIKDQKADIPVDEEINIYLSQEDKIALDVNKEPDRLYLVKWQNLSYSNITWEHEGVINCPNQINDYKNFNRALDKESRNLMNSQFIRHKQLLDIQPGIIQSKKQPKLTHGQYQEIKNKLYHYDIASYKQPFQYTPKTQPIYKERKLLRDYQLESLNWMIQSWYHQRNVILADEMGLGKTIQSMAFLNHLYTIENIRGPFLVIAPLSTLSHWKRSMEDWTNMNSLLYYDDNSHDGRSFCRHYEWYYVDISTKGNVLPSQILKFQVIITSYEVFMQDLVNVFLPIPFQFIIVDEAHRLKNQNAKILGALQKLPCQRTLLLTGTPVQNCSDELWTLLNYIQPDKFNNLSTFQRQFGELKTAEQVDRLQKSIKPFLLRRMKEDVENSIPPLQETIIDIEMTMMQKTIYRAIYQRNKSMLQKSFMSTSNNAASITSLNNLEMQLRKCCNHPFLIKEFENEMNKQAITEEEHFKQIIETSGKMLLLQKLLEKFKKENKKVLIFSQFTHMLVILQDYLKIKGYRFEKIDGSIKSRDRQNSIDRFNNPDQKRDVFLLSTKAGGLGINLTSAQVVIIYDSDWNPQNDVQATARAHRIGQTQEVQVYRFITKKTYEAEMFERATQKLGLDQALFSGGDFKNTGLKNGQGVIVDNSATKLSVKGESDKKKEIQMLLKKGILGFFEKQDEEQEKKANAYFDDNIETILEKNTRVAKFSLIKGTYSFSKSSFQANKTGSDVNLDDPDFWDQVLKDAESQTLLLKNELDLNLHHIVSSYPSQQNFIFRVSEFLNILIESKLSHAGYNADDEKNITDILHQINETKGFHQQYRDLCLNWYYEIMRPTRRFQKYTSAELDVSRLDINLNKQLVYQPSDTGNAGLGDEIFGEEDSDGEEKQNNNLMGGNGSSLVVAPIINNSFIDSNAGKKHEKSSIQIVTDKMKDDIIKKLCYYCEKPNCTVVCEGICKRSFHQNCVKKVDSGWINIKGPDPTQKLVVDEDKYDSERLKKMVENGFICKDCKENTVICYICKKKGQYYGVEPRSRSKKPASTNPEKTQQEEDPAATASGQRDSQDDETPIIEEEGVVVGNQEDSEKQVKTKTSKQKDDQDDEEQQIIQEEEEPEAAFEQEEQEILEQQNEDNAGNKEAAAVEGGVAAPSQRRRGGPKQVNQLTRCSTANCNQFYHLECIKGNPLFKYIDQRQRRFRCSLHYCANCSVSGDSMAIAQCFRCPKSYHHRCWNKEEIVQLNKQTIICPDHANDLKVYKAEVQKAASGNTVGGSLFAQNNTGNKVSRADFSELQQENDEAMNKIISQQITQQIQTDESPSGNDLKSGVGIKASVNDTNVKISMTEDSRSRSTRGAASGSQGTLDGFFKGGSSQKGSSKSNDQSIIQIKKSEIQLDDDDGKENYDQSDEIDEDELLDEDDEVMGGYHKSSKRDSQKKKSKSGGGSGPIVQEKIIPKFSYEDLQITSPKEFNYDTWNHDWCKYCGARFASNFTQGPWGPRTLCTVHYIAWYQKKQLNLSNYKELPKVPINPEDPNELLFINKVKSENPDFDPKQELDEGNDGKQKVRRTQ